jgi:DNA-binding Lrp family transcriptional regulator
MSITLKLDAIDKKIMALLAVNGRMRDLDLAKAIGVSDDTIRRHRQRLEDEGCFRIEAVFNSRKFGYTSTYQLGLVLAPGVNTRTIAEKLANLERVNYVALSLGPTHSILANSRAREAMELNMLVEELRTWKEIERVDVNIVYDVVKAMSHRLPEEALE